MEATDASRLVCVVVVSYQESYNYEYSLTFLLALVESHKKPSAQQAGRSRTRCSLDAGERMAHALDGGEAKNTRSGRPLA